MKMGKKEKWQKGKRVISKKGKKIKRAKMKNGRSGTRAKRNTNDLSLTCLRITDSEDVIGNGNKRYDVKEAIESHFDSLVSYYRDKDTTKQESYKKVT